MAAVMFIILFGGFFFFLIIAIIMIFMMLSWNIPITVLRFTGNKQRPLIIHKKGRKKNIKGVPYLWIKGYNTPIRDYKAEYYYPTPKNKWGGLILWEFEDGWLTPTPPKGVKFSKEQEKSVKLAIGLLNDVRPVEFEYDPEMHQRLKLRIVDDVDAEFAVEQWFRQKKQYSGGLMDFFSEHASSIILVLTGTLLLVGFIVWLDKSPEMMAQCAAVAKSTVLDAIKEEGVKAIVPPG